MANLSHCASEVHKHDRDRFLASLFVPQPAREALLALAALQVELAQIGMKVREEMIAQLRFAWWQEALVDLYAGKSARGHPVLEALKLVIEGGHVPKEALVGLVEQYRECFPETPAGDGLNKIVVALLQSLSAGAEEKWCKVMALIEKHRKHYGKGWNGWLAFKLLLAGGT